MADKKLPRFENEAEEARWWFEHRGEGAGALGCRGDGHLGYFVFAGGYGEEGAAYGSLVLLALLHGEEDAAAGGEDGLLRLG